MIIIAPFAQKLINGKRNPKNYPFWPELIEQLKGQNLVQVGRSGEDQLVDDFRVDLPVSELRQLLRNCKVWIGVDSFFQHLAWDEGKPGIVLWSVSDPLIYGHLENVNLLKDRSYLAENQFLMWDFTPHNEDAFVKPDVVVNAIANFL
jgi:ADP-heptose:LPS heptosyltransferase